MMLRNVGNVKLHGIVSLDMSTLLLGAVDFELIPERNHETFTHLYSLLTRPNFKRNSGLFNTVIELVQTSFENCSE